MKKALLTFYYFLAYMLVRVFYTPFFWIGVPAFTYWISDTERTSNQIKFITWCYLMAIIWYFTFWWVAVLVTVVAFGIVVFQILRAGSKMPLILAMLFTLTACVKDEQVPVIVRISDGDIATVKVNEYTFSETDTLMLNIGTKVKYSYTHEGDVLVEFISLKYGERLEASYSVMGKTSGKFRVR